MSWSRTDATLHLEATARRHKILIAWRRRTWRRYEAHVDTRMVFIGEPHTARDYLAALHEMGHIVSRHSVAAGKRKDCLTEEAAAWDWALRNASVSMREHLTERHRREIGGAWATYIPTG